MQVLLLSTIAKCGVFTHVRELALYMKKFGVKPIIGMIHNPNTTNKFKLKKIDLKNLEKSLNEIDYFFYESDKDLLNKIHKLQIDIVHAHSPLVLDSSVNISQKLKIPFIITLH